MNNPATRPYSITTIRSDHPNPPLPPAQVGINPKEVQAHHGDVATPGKLHWEPPRHLHQTEGEVWKIPCILLGMLWMEGMLGLMGILRGWQRLLVVRRGVSLGMGWPERVTSYERSE